MQIPSFRKELCCYRQSWGKEIFSEACVKNSVHRGGLPACWDTPQEQTPPLEADTPTPRKKTPPPHRGGWGGVVSQHALQVT